MLCLHLCVPIYTKHMSVLPGLRVVLIAAIYVIFALDDLDGTAIDQSLHPVSLAGGNDVLGS